MDKSWITAPIASNIFKNGVEYFINFASVRAIRGSIVCPCPRCCNCKLLAINSVHAHILRYGFLTGYTTWTFHGENVVPSTLSESSIGQETVFPQDDIRGLVRDALGVSSVPLNDEEVRDSTFEKGESGRSFDHGEEDITYKRLLEECDKELYSGCKYTNLSFTLHLYHVKCIGGISNKAFGMLLELLRDAFPHLTSLPSSVNETKKLTKDLGLGYEKIHACPNDCMLYWGDRKDQQSCHVCKAPRYKSDLGDEGSKSSKSNKPSKVFRYFPLIPRLKRIYMSEITAKEMRWHDIGLTKDGKLRHPADGLAWKEFDSRYPDFASDARSVRLGLSSDGFNPFRTLSTTHSTWPVLLIPYNLPPWVCMKPQSFILSAIIPGEKGPGNDIDVYLQPLIQELKLLWKGVDAYDAFSKQQFKLNLQKVINRREANDVEFFSHSHLMKNGSYAKVASRELLDRAQEGIYRKISEAESFDTIDAEKRSEIVREVMNELRGPSKRGRPPSYGAGVKRSQVTKFGFDLRKLRGKTIANENRYLLDKVDSQSKQIESQRKQIETQNRQIEFQSKQMSIMEQKIDECTGELRLFRTAFPDIYGARISSTSEMSSRELHQNHP